MQVINKWDSSQDRCDHSLIFLHGGNSLVSARHMSVYMRGSPGKTPAFLEVIIIWCVCACMHTCLLACIWSSEDKRRRKSFAAYIV